jgi:putative flippase GtrA
MGERDGSAHMGSSKVTGTSTSPGSSHLDTLPRYLQAGWSVLSLALALAALGALFSVLSHFSPAAASLVGSTWSFRWPSRCLAR